MSPPNKGKLVFTALLLVLTLGFVIAAFNYEPRSRMVPLLIGVITFVIGVIALVHEIRPISLLNRFDMSVMDLSGKAETAPEKEEAVDSRFLASIGWITAFLLVSFLAGFHIGILFFMTAFLKIRGGFGWFKSIGVAIAVWGLIYVMFEVAMGFSLFKGLFFGEILPIL